MSRKNKGKLDEPKKGKGTACFTTFTSLAGISDHGIQCLLREIEHTELALALSGTARSTGELFFRNMSERAGALIREEMEAILPVKRRAVRAARKHVLETANRLQTAGAITCAGSGAKAPPVDQQQAMEASKVQEQKDCLRRLVGLVKDMPLGKRSTSEMITPLVAMAEVARRAGILSLEEALPLIDEPFLKKGVALIIDGTDPALVKQLLSRKKQALLAEQERRLDMYITATLSISAGDNPRILEEKCQTYFAE